MNIIKWLVLVAICFFGYRHWEKTHKAPSEDIAVYDGDSGSDSGSGARHPSGNGFVSLPPFDGADSRRVVIFAPENCPEDGARRADDLADQLSRKGIPVMRSSHANFSDISDSATANKVMSVMNGEIPIVIVKGRGKANPSVEEVVSEYGGAGI